jgi:cytochrome c biogenesis protein CcdA
MNTIITCYVIYIALSLGLTIWVARTLHRNGRIFLVQAFHNNEQMADSVNHLLVVGFYLINVGYIALALKFGDKPNTVQEAFEFLSTKIGLVLVVLGGMHFFNMFNFDKMRRKGTRPVATEPPVIAAAQ